MRAVHLIRRRAQRPRTNPFHFGDVALGEQFIDRTAELGELLGDLRSGQNVLVLAPRRFGKTSLIVATAERLRKDRLSTSAGPRSVPVAASPWQATQS